jgi:hypothetical protein
LIHLQELLNADNCDAIYSEASDEFHGLESRDQWLRTCNDLRSSLGLWTDFSLAEVDAQGLLVHGNGTAIFSTGAGSFHLTWRLSSGRARLFSLHLRSTGQDFFVPRVSRHPEPLMDPPPKRRLAVDTTRAPERSPTPGKLQVGLGYRLPASAANDREVACSMNRAGAMVFPYFASIIALLHTCTMLRVL